jgi:transcriptional regulator with XRE-family HTH domain
MKLRQILAINLKRFRHEAGWSQEDLAGAAGIDRTYVSALERCRYGATVDVLERLANAFEKEAAELLLTH